MDNNIGFVPFSPIASGLLSVKITPQTQFEKNDDVRNWVPHLSRRIIENLDSFKMVLTDEEFESLEEALNGLKVYGHRGLGGF